jgi:hypothetical protein
LRRGERCGFFLQRRRERRQIGTAKLDPVVVPILREEFAAIERECLSQRRRRSKPTRIDGRPLVGVTTS